MSSPVQPNFIEVPDYNCDVKEEFVSDDIGNITTQQLDDVYYEEQENLTDTSTTDNLPNYDATILDGKYFKVVLVRENKHVDAQCQMCLPNNKIIKGRLQSSSNFLKHMKSSHPDRITEYTTYKTAKRNGLLKEWSNEMEEQWIDNDLLEPVGEEETNSEDVDLLQDNNVNSSQIKQEFNSEYVENTQDPSLIESENTECNSKDYPYYLDGGAVLDGKYFKIINITNNKLVEAECQMCLPRFKIIRGCVQSSSNFLKHMKNTHADKLSEYREYKMLRRNSITRPKADDWNKPESAEVITSDDSNQSVLVPGQSDPPNTNDIQTILDGRYFKIVKIHNNNCVEAECQLCLPMRRILKGNLLSSSNYIKHMKIYHLDKIPEYNEYKAVRRTIRRKRKAVATQESSDSKTPVGHSDLQSALKYPRLSEELPKQQNCDNSDVITEVDAEIKQQSLDQTNLVLSASVTEENMEEECVSDDSNQKKVIFDNIQSTDVHIILDGKFFKVLIKGQNNYVEAVCQMCLPREKVIKGNLYSSSNFMQHMKNVHPDKVHEFQTYKMHKLCVNKQGLSTTITTTTSNNTKLETNIAQTQFEKKVASFIINTLTPLSILENKSFVNLFENYKLPNQQELMIKLTQMHEEQIAELKLKLNSSNYLCNTADLWSNGKITFLGVTIHLIDESLKRYSAVIACKRLKEKSDYKRIGELLENINLKFGIAQENVVSSIVCMGVKDTEIQHDDDFKLVNIDSAEEPKQLRCGTDVLNLIGTLDYKTTVKSNDLLANRHTASFGKCSSLLLEVKKPKSAEILYDLLGFSLTIPIPTKLASIHESVSQIVKERSKLPTLFERLGLNYFRETELLYLEEYITVMKPLADTINLLQNENNSYYGYLLPSLLSLRIKYEKMRTQLQFKCGGDILLETCLNALQTRFSDFYNLSNDDAIISAVLLPNFKLRWYNAVKNPTKSIDDIKKTIISKAEDILNMQQASQPSNTDEGRKTDEYDDSFFDFDDDFDSKASRNVGNNKSKIELELHRYLDDQRSALSMLEDFEILKKVFRKYNACLPGSSPVERLFSFGSVVNTPSRNAMSDEVFEKLVMLQANGGDVM